MGAMIMHHPLPAFALIAPLVLLVIAVGYLIVAGLHPLRSMMHIVRITDRDQPDRTGRPFEMFDPEYKRTC